MARVALAAVAALLFVSAVVAQTGDTCTIAKCESTSKCVKKQFKGVSTRVWTCSKCLASYKPSNDARACVCPPGTYETTNGCERCPAGSYCKGGSKVLIETLTSTSADRGPIAACDTVNQANGIQTTAAGLTSPRGARKISQCITRPGFRLTAIGQATAQSSQICAANSYNPGGNRATRCQLCPNGLETDPAATPATRVAKASCLVKPGWFWNIRAAKPFKACPKNTYRSGYVKAFADSVCLSCPEGVLTADEGSTSVGDCSKIKGGYEATEVVDGVILETQPCKIGSWSPTRDYTALEDCTDCNTGFTTQYAGSDESGDCVPNDESDDVTVTCPADGMNYGFDPVVNSKGQSQTFKITEDGVVKGIELFFWGLPSASVGTTGYKLTLRDTSSGDVVGVPATATVDNLGADCSADAIDLCDGDWVRFDFGAGYSLTTANTYKWELECTTAATTGCGFFGYCDYSDIADGTAFEDNLDLDRDNAFNVYLVPNAPQLRKLD